MAAVLGGRFLERPTIAPLRAYASASREPAWCIEFDSSDGALRATVAYQNFIRQGSRDTRICFPKSGLRDAAPSASIFSEKEVRTWPTEHASRPRRPRRPA